MEDHAAACDRRIEVALARLADEVEEKNSGETTKTAAIREHREKCGGGVTS